MKRNKKNLIGSGFILGTIIGAASTFFLAPRTGIETQKKVIKKINKGMQKSIIKAQNGLLNLELFLEKRNRK